MIRHGHARPFAVVARQPILTAIAKRNAKARELAAAMRMPCIACRASLASHIGPRNRWIGCRGNAAKGAR